MMRIQWQPTVRNRSLVMCVAHPRECTRDGDADEDVGDDADREYCVVVVLVVNEDGDHLEDQP